MVTVHYKLEEIIEDLSYAFKAQCYKLSKEGASDFYKIHKHFKDKGYVEDSPLKMPGDNYGWVGKIKEYDCIFIKNANTTIFKYVIILHKHKYLDENGFTCFRYYEDANTEIFNSSNKADFYYMLGNTIMEHSDNVPENSYVHRADIKYITDNIDTMIDDEKYNIIKPILKYPVLKDEILSTYELDFKKLGVFNCILQSLLHDTFID